VKDYKLFRKSTERQCYLLGELEDLKIKMRLIDEKFASVMCVCVFVKL
jgi:hypothetical protein